MDIRKYRDIIIKIQGLYYKSNWEWNKDDRNYKEIGFLKTRGILPRIRNICLNECRTLQPQHKTTQLWFLPLGSGKIKNKIKALIALFTLNEFKDVKENYHFFAAVDIEDKTKKGEKVMAFINSDYIDVATRIGLFREKHPEGSLQPADLQNPFYLKYQLRCQSTRPYRFPDCTMN